jgi:hypothetical protein
VFGLKCKSVVGEVVLLTFNLHEFQINHFFK